MHIHIQWDGPFSYEESLELKNEFKDYGIYQIYGAHPVYGSNVLLYIGKAEIQTFGQRLTQEKWRNTNQDASNLAIYVGRLSGFDGHTDTSIKAWNHKISLAEKLLIYAHWPAGNSSGLNTEFGEDVHEAHILNWGKYRDLLPEVSGARYSDLYGE